MNQTVDEFMGGVIDELCATHRHGTARLYRAVRGLLRRYSPYVGLTFDRLDAAWLTAFDAYLVATEKSRNTRSTYHRVLRAKNGAYWVRKNGDSGSLLVLRWQS